MRWLGRWTTAAAIVLVCSASPALAVDSKRVDDAVDDGREWLFAQQEPDGHWDAKFHDAYPMGPTALATWALLKSGADPNDPRILKAFAWLRKAPLRKTYSVSCLIMALEARSAPDPARAEAQGKPYETVARAVIPKRMPGPDKKLLARAAAWLLKVQHADGYWKYPGYGEQDMSNAQFAILALKAAERAGVRVPPAAYDRHLRRILADQETTGPSVPAFEVPAANGPIALLDPRAVAAWAEEMRTRTRDEAMTARGWAYRPGEHPRASMTAAGVATTIVCKSVLERVPGWEKKHGAQTDAAIRDGVAWLAHHFSVEKNAQAGGAEKDWLHYYLFTLERAGTLAAVRRLGGHDWYDEGARFLLDAQKADGSWAPDYDGERCGPINDTSFALLFLTRATPPVMERPTTGGPADDGAVAGGAPAGPQVRATGDGRFEVTFTVAPTEAASTVHLAGSFNGWSKEATPLDRRGDAFVVTVVLDRGRHTYKFVLDGGRRWIDDPGNAAGEPDGHGGKNSILEIP